MADARALVSRLLRQVTEVPGGDAALALPQGYFGAQHSCLFPSILSVSLVTGRSTAQRPAKQQRSDRRALVTALAVLSRSPRLDFRAFYDSFWRDAVLEPVAKLNPDGRSYVSLNRWVAFVDDLSFMLALPRTPTAQHFEQLLEFLRAPDSDSLSPGDRQLLLSELQARPKTVTAAIVLDVSSAVLKPSTIQSLARVLDAYAKTPDEQLRQCAVLFRPMMLWFDQCRISDPKVWDELAALVESAGCRIPSIVLFYSQIKSDRHHLLGFRQFIHRSVASPASSSLRSLNFLGTHLKYDQVTAILSALWYPNSMEELCLEHFCDAECSHMMLWMWIALGVFHPDSKSRLRHLNLTHFHFRGAELVLRDRLLTSRAPVTVLLYTWKLFRLDDGLPLPDDRRRVVCFQVGAKMLSMPAPRSSVLLETSDSTREYELSYANERWVAVLMPGYGVVWARSSSVVSERDIPSRLIVSDDAPPTLPRRQFQSFTYRDISTADSVMAVVQLLGDELETLDLENSEITGAELAQILRLFPRLATLNIRAPADTGLQALLQHCREVAAGGSARCSLSTLEVSMQSTAEVRQLAELLSDASGRSIERIRLYVKQNEAMEALGDVARVLAHNRSLAYLGIFTRFDEGVWALFREYQSEVLRFVLPMTHKAALLSVVRDPSSQGKAVRLLDAGVLSVIFQFASVPLRREIHIFDEYE